MLARYDNVYAAIGRFLLGLYFVVPGITKVVGYADTLALMQSKGVPLADLLLPLTIVMQIGLGGLLMINRQVRFSALALFGLTILINVFIHNFWALAGDPSQAHETQNFVKNLAIAAGLLVLAGRSQNK